MVPLPARQKSPIVQSLVDMQVVRHCWSFPQTCPTWHEVLAQVASSGSWHTPVVPDRTQRSPVAQSRDCLHSLWHRPNAQMRLPLQSLLIEHVWSRPADPELLQLATATAAAAPTASAIPAPNRTR